MPISTLSGISSSRFYEIPIPYIFGALPFSSNRENEKDTYSYKKIWTVPRIFNSYDNYYKDKGVGKLFYNEFFKKYTIVICNNVEDLYPHFSNLYFNPFINDESGYCSWNKNGEFNNRKIYWSDESNNYRYDSNFNYLNGVSYTINNDLSFCDDITNKNYSNEDIENENLVGILSRYYNDYITYLSSPEESLYNLSSINTYFKFEPIIENTYISDTSELLDYVENNQVYFRTDILPDLDYEDGLCDENMCGVYSTDLISSHLSTFKQCAIGSFVLGSESDKNFGRFIGITNTFFTSKYNAYSPYVKVYPDYGNKPRLIHGNVEAERSRYWYMGKTYDKETPKHLVMFLSTKFTEDEHLKPNRYFILEGEDSNPVTYRKFWYFDAPNMPDNTINENYINYYSLFKASTKWYNLTNDFVNEYTFKYMNLDDPKDIKPDITLTPIGMTRKNPWVHLFGDKLKYGSNEILKKDNILYKNIYIGNWITPQTEITEI